MVHSDGIWNDLELQRNIWNGAFWLYFKRFGTAVKKKEKKTVNCDFWRYLKRFGTTEIILKQGRFRVHYDTFWNDIWNSYEIKKIKKIALALTSLRGCEEGRALAIPDFFLENKDVDWCILTLLKRYFWYFENILKIRTVNGPFCRYLIRCFDMQGKCWK